jgi:hypothetical protein
MGDSEEQDQGLSVFDIMVCGDKSTHVGSDMIFDGNGELVLVVDTAGYIIWRAEREV